MMESTSRGSTLWARALCATRSEIAADAWEWAEEADELADATTFRTSFRVRGSTRTTTVFRTAVTSAVAVETASAARMGEAACITSASMEQIYTFLFSNATGLSRVKPFLRKSPG